LDSLEAIIYAPAGLTRAERLLLFTLVFCLRPQRYLEIGTFMGGSALIVAAALDALESKGRMFCVDPCPQIAAEHLARLESRATFLRGHSPGILPQALHLAGRPFDLVLIDGDHTYAGVLHDAQGVLPCTRPGSYMLFHDGFHPDVRRAIDDFVIAHREEVVDLGLLTREVTIHVDEDGQEVEWGGLRLVYAVSD
jgi:predicted O-methyltransferase YrrM